MDNHRPSPNTLYVGLLKIILKSHLLKMFSVQMVRNRLVLWAHLLFIGLSPLRHGIMGARRNFSRGGNHQHFKKLTRFRRAVQKSTIFRRAEGANENCCVFSRRFRLKYRVFIASAVGASENFRVFCRAAAYDVILFQIHGGRQVPPPLPPLWAPMLRV